MQEDSKQFLMDLQKELLTQDHDHQADPRFWVIGDYRYDLCHEGEEDITFINSGEKEYYDSTDNFINYIEEEIFYDWELELNEDKLNEIKSEFHEAKEDLYYLLQWAKKYFAEDSILMPLKEKHFIHENVMFLTKEDAKKHLKTNYYHYTNKAHTYAMTAWRSPKVEKLLNVLKTFDWSSI